MKRIAAALALALCASCSGSDVKNRPSAETLYAEANQELEGRKLLWLIPVRDYQAAIEGFKKVIDLYPYGHWAVMAELRIADATYHKGDYLEAVALYKEFHKKHPTNENIPYVFYQMGICYLEYQDGLAMAGGIPHDRDMTAVDNALVEFTYLTDNYPSSPYAGKAKDRLAQCVDLEAKHEIYVGDFYYSQSKYQSAIPRFKKVADTYGSSPYAERALFLLGKCYAEIGQSANARDILMKVLEKYPEGSYASDARSVIASLPPRD